MNTMGLRLAETWIEHENEVWWFEQRIKRSERPQLVGRMFEALCGPGKKAMQSLESDDVCWQRR